MKKNGAKQKERLPDPNGLVNCGQVPPANALGGEAGVMTLREVAQYLGLHVMTVYKLTREGRVPAAKIGGQWRFKRNVLDEWLESQMHRHTN